MSPDPGSELEVFLHDEAVGRLTRLPRAKLRFVYHPAWVEAQGRPLSLSLPVRPEPYEPDECGPFFEGLLPEDDFLRAVARVFHVSAGNPFSVLAEIGGECAGAVGVAGVGSEAPGTTSRSAERFWTERSDRRSTRSERRKLRPASPSRPTSRTGRSSSASTR